MTDIAGITQAVFDVERELGLLDLAGGGAWPWERIRFDVQRALTVGAGLIDEPQWRLGKHLGARLVVAARRAQDGFRRSPWSASPAELFFVGHPRRKRSSDGTWWDLYCDPILPELRGRFVYAEEPDQGGHRTPARTPDVRYLDGVWLASALAERLARVRLPGDCATAFSEAGERLQRHTGVSVDPCAMARRALARRRAALPLYRSLLAKLRPRVVVVVVGYGKESLIEAARERGVPVVELQHGVIHPQHTGYAFPTGTKRHFADWLLTFGDHWCDAVRYPIPRERVVSVGFPYFEAEAARFEATAKRDQVLFLSQPAIGARLSALAAGLAGRHPWRVVYKLHPAEYGDWRERYPWLADARVQVLDSDDVLLYRLFAESRAQVGVFSTAVYEGLGFGLPTFLAALPGVESMQSLVASGAAQRVKSPEELATALTHARARRTAIDVERFFRRDSARRLVATLERIARGSDASAEALAEDAKDE